MKQKLVVRKKNKISKDDILFLSFAYIIVIFLLILVAYPIIYVVSASFSSGAAVNSGKVWLLPVDLTLDGYKAVFAYEKVWIGYKNTIIYTAVGTVFNICITMMCAYPMARKKLAGKKYIMLFFAFTMFFSGGMIPSYLLIKKLGLYNSMLALILPGGMSVYNMIVARTFIQVNIPDELLEATKLDGGSDNQFFFHVVLPLSKTIIAVLALWYAVGHWNSYFSALLYLQDMDKMPLQIYLRELLVNDTASMDILDAESYQKMMNSKTLMKYVLIVVATAPLVAVYPFAQKYFMKGVMVGSLKG